MQVDSQLYTIESNVPDEDSRVRRNHPQTASDRLEEASSSSSWGPPGRLTTEQDGHGGADVYSQLRRGPRGQLRHSPDGSEGNLKDAIVTAAETNVTLAHYRDWVVRQRERRRRWMRGPTGRLKAALAAAYKRYVVEGLLRQKPLPPTKDGRHVPVEPGLARRNPLLDERTGKPYPSNYIRSSRYTLWDFLPRQLLFQFSKLANFYFLVIGIMQMIPDLSTTGTYTTIGPLLAFVGLSIGKEGYDDYRRYKLDKVENRSPAFVLDPDGTVDNNAGRRWTKEELKKTLKRPLAGRNTTDLGVTELQGINTGGGGGGSGGDSDGDSGLGPWSKVQWQQLRVGDIVRLRRDDDVPADIVLLHATGPNGIAYIETMALDGETNLKSKQACQLLADYCKSLSGVTSCGATVVSEDPNIDLYNYEGRVAVGGQTMPLTMNEVVYRGSTLRNTNQAIGLVVNTGEECKIRMNAHKNVHTKAPAMQAIVNRIVILLVFLVVMLSFGCTIGNEVWKDDYKPDAWYLDGADVPFKQIIIAFIIAFNTLIPLSLYVSLEIVKLGQFFLLHDVDMYDPVTDTPMVANTTTILENLGQVSYVFSDKTGTLTENVMRFRKMSVAGTAFLHDMDLQREAVEEERRRNSPGAKRKNKGKQKEKSPLPAARSPDRSDLDDADYYSDPLLDGGNPYQHDPNARPNSGNPPRTSSVSQWTSSARPVHRQPALKTEEFIRYLRHRPHTSFSRKARHFILCIALCHTCLPETDDRGNVTFQAASPDELALVEAARDLGYLLIDRPAQSIHLQFRDLDGSTIMKTYQVLDVIEFSSKRKRMSIIIRMPDGKICMFTKGADSAILPRLKLNNLAAQKASAVERRASKRKSVEQEKALQRRSTQRQTRENSMQLARAASTMSPMNNSMRRKGSGVKRSASMHRKSSAVLDEVDSWLTRRETEEMEDQFATEDDVYLGSGAPARISTGRKRSAEFAPPPDIYDGVVDERLAVNEGAVFERCFQHIDDFATEGLRTLLFAYRYLEEDEYKKWKSVYQEATTSLVDRQERIEAAAELVEQGFDLAGVTAIEDKLQKGVPETVDKLRRANIKVWMLTGDKRETAINIAHSARICKPFSEVYILDATKGDLQEKIASTLIDVGRAMIPHSVVVIDGHTLGVVEEDESVKILFFDLAARVDSVICCRASPSQKAMLVKRIRRQVPSALSLAIGDGANDIAMIQASHVGIGISGREGLQAARISDYSIAQFRFLQKLLFVHGRWNYIRTGKYILATFWKEIVFYLTQAQYQRYNGYTGTSLYEPISLTVFNTLFTSLPVVLVGIFEQDLCRETLLAVPELYTFGQKNLGFNFKQYIWWMFMATSSSIMIFHVIYGIYNASSFTVDTSLFAMGDLSFTVCVIFINIKMLVLEMHNQTIISFVGLIVSIGGWFLWNLFLGAIYPETQGPYIVHNAFVENFGRSAVWWFTAAVVLSAVIIFELAVAAVRRVFRPRDQDLMQELQQDSGFVSLMEEHADNRAAGGDAVTTMLGALRQDEEMGTKATHGGGGGDARPDAASGRPSTTVTTVEVSSEMSSQESVVGVEPRGAATAVSAVPPWRLSRQLTDQYIPPPFTPLPEEHEDPLESVAAPPTATTGETSSDTVGKTTERTSSKRWIIETNHPPTGDEGNLSPYFVQSPVELHSPPLGRRGRGGESSES